MKIAIVDDEPFELYVAKKYLINYIHENWADYEQDINIEIFFSAKDLLKIFKPGMYQLIILDICMDEINGMQAAKIIRSRGDTDVNIVFLTSNDDYILNGYQVFAVGYFLKPITNHAEEFAKTFEHIFTKLCKKNPELIVNVDGTEFLLPYQKIFFIDIDYNHKLCFHLAEKKFLVTLNSYAEIYNILSNDERFLECYHRIIVNMDYITSMETDNFILIDDTHIPISKRKKKEVKVSFMRYLAHK